MDTTLRSRRASCCRIGGMREPIGRCRRAGANRTGAASATDGDSWDEFGGWFDGEGAGESAADDEGAG